MALESIIGLHDLKKFGIFSEIEANSGFATSPSD
jgi:hypothetical protein